LRQAFPLKSLGEIETALKQMAVDLGRQGDDDDYGSGLLNVAAAYNLLADVSPSLVVSDPTPSANDGNIDFGSVAPFASGNLSLRLENGGGGFLTISSLDLNSASTPFSVTNDLCSGRTLDGGGSCTVDLIFAPQSFGSFAANLIVVTAAPAGSRVLALGGLGNNAPPIANLQLPLNGAVAVARPVTFRWQREADLDGDVVSESLLISVHGDFSDRNPIPTAFLPQGVSLLAGGGLLFGLWRGKKVTSWLLMLILFLALLQVSCGGGGNASPASVPLSPTGEYQSANLQSGTTYYWKIRSVDSRGGASESAVWSFKTL
jgi:hypothetical protein